MIVTIICKARVEIAFPVTSVNLFASLFMPGACALNCSWPVLSSWWQCLFKRDHPISGGIRSPFCCRGHLRHYCGRFQCTSVRPFINIPLFLLQTYAVRDMAFTWVSVSRIKILNFLDVLNYGYIRWLSQFVSSGRLLELVRFAAVLREVFMDRGSSGVSGPLPIGPIWSRLPPHCH